MGDTLANLLAFAGYKVTKEYVINDAGAQIDVLGRSAFLRYREALGEEIGEIPSGLYPGDYLVPVGQALASEYGRSLLEMDEVEALAIERACKLFGAEAANVQPHSGSQANMAAYFSCLSVGDTVLGMNLAHGGHLTYALLRCQGRPDPASNRPPTKRPRQASRRVGRQIDEDQSANTSRLSWTKKLWSWPSLGSSELYFDPGPPSGTCSSG